VDMLAICEREIKKYKCGFCGKEFKGIRNTEDNRIAFCSKKCYLLFQENPIIASTCKYCGKPFQKRKTHNKNRLITFCDSRCYNKFLKKEKME
jgi:endogenous inhibitor of DNA gyrase (YacG/DUF329 family)